MARSARGKTWGALLDAARRCPLYRRGHRRATVAHPGPLHRRRHRRGHRLSVTPRSARATRARRRPQNIGDIRQLNSEHNRQQGRTTRWPLADAGRRWPTLATLADAGRRWRRTTTTWRTRSMRRRRRRTARWKGWPPLSAFGAARRVRRCSARSALLGASGAARRCSTLLGAFGAARRVRRCSARSTQFGTFGAAKTPASAAAQLAAYCSTGSCDERWLEDLRTEYGERRWKTFAPRLRSLRVDGTSSGTVILPMRLPNRVR